jgi:dipeptidyl aminopeptidase/acylaminoacyl peptidase
MRKVYFKDREGINLCGIISDLNTGKTKPIVIFCHGLASGKDGLTYKGLERILNKNNISTFRFDFWGHGESEGRFEDVTVSRAIEEVLNAISFIKNEGYSKVGLMGSSFGGLASIVAASKNNDLFVLALKSPVSNFGETMSYGKWEKIKREAEKNGYTFYIDSKGEKVRLNYSFFEDAGRISGYEFAKNIKIPTLIVHGDMDKAVKIEQSKKTAKLIPNCKLEVISQFIIRNS